MIEYRLRPVTRYIVTRYETSPEIPGTNNRAAGSIKTLGEYDNAYIAYEVGYALAKAEADRLEIPPGSMELIYPQQIIEEPIAGQIGGVTTDKFPVGHFMKPGGRIG